MKTVCIGGPCDAERVEIPDSLAHGAMWQIPLDPDSGTMLQGGTSGLVQFVDYRCVVLGFGQAGTKLLAYQTLSPGDLLQKLVENYHPQAGEPQIFVPGGRLQ
jgi:hypothetical protein